MKPNLDQLLDDAGVPSTAEVLLEELEREKERGYALANALRRTRGELKECKQELRKLVREKKKQNKRVNRDGKTKKGRYGESTQMLSLQEDY